MPEFPRELSILHQGSLLSMSGEKTLSLFARNVRAIRVEVGRLLPRQLQHLVTQIATATSRLPMFTNWAFDAANITERFVRVAGAAAGAAGQSAVRSARPRRVPGRRTAATVAASSCCACRRGIRDDNRRARVRRRTGTTRRGSSSDARLLVVTDLGLVAKRSVDGSQDVFVQSIATGAPVAGATVEIIGRNGLPVLTRDDATATVTCASRI